MQRLPSPFPLACLGPPAALWPPLLLVALGTGRPLGMLVRHAYGQLGILLASLALCVAAIECMTRRPRVRAEARLVGRGLGGRRRQVLRAMDWRIYDQL